MSSSNKFSFEFTSPVIVLDINSQVTNNIKDITDTFIDFSNKHSTDFIHCSVDTTVYTCMKCESSYNSWMRLYVTIQNLTYKYTEMWQALAMGSWGAYIYYVKNLSGNLSLISKNIVRIDNY